MRKPNFIGVGGQKCASTWISECLRYHPDVYMSDVKEIHYFNKNYDRGMDWYLSHFEGAGPEKKAVGEFSTLYLTDPVTPRRIKEDLGDVKIVASIRNPVDRFISHYKHNIRLGRLSETAFGELTLANYKAATAQYPSMLGNGLYSAGIERYRELFGAQNVLVLVKDDIDLDPRGQMKKLFAFLGVDETAKIDVVDKTVSAGIVPKHIVLEKIRVGLYRLFKKLNPKVITWVKKSGLSESYREMNAKKDDLKIAPEVYAALRAYYEPEIQKIEELLGRTFPDWRK